MNEFKGTEGDWIVDCVDKHGYFITSDSQQNAIAKVYQLFEDDQKAKSNADLVSAAPDLLSACLEFVRKVECGQARSTKSYAQMKTAINKALGINE